MKTFTFSLIAFLRYIYIYICHLAFIITVGIQRGNAGTETVLFDQQVFLFKFDHKAHTYDQCDQMAFVCWKFKNIKSYFTFLLTHMFFISVSLSMDESLHSILICHFSFGTRGFD